MENRNMESRNSRISKLWKVVSLEASKSKEAIPIERRVFENILSSYNGKGYKKRKIEGDEIEYRDDSVPVSFFINKGQRTIRVEGNSESAISKVISDFELPAY